MVLHAVPKLAQNLRIARLAARLSQRAAAARLEISDVTVSNHETGATTPDEAMLDKYSALYGWTAVEFRYGKGAERLQNPLPGAVPVPESAELPRPLDILASEFEVEAMKAGADKHDMRYIRMALRSREATEIYHGGYQEPASENEQRTEMENTIAMLRVWLKGRIRRRKPAKKSS